MKSVGEAANQMVREVARQWKEIPGLTDTASLTFEERAQKRAKGEALIKPDYDLCIAIATNASLKEMVPPAILVIVTPILVGSIFGVEACVGFLAGALASSVQLAISMSNTGGAWDNAKKYAERGDLNGWFRFNDGKSTITDAEFKAAAAKFNGDDCLLVPDTPQQSRGVEPVVGGAVLAYPQMTMPVMYPQMTTMPAGAIYGSQAMVSGGQFGYGPGMVPMVGPMGPVSPGPASRDVAKPVSFKKWLTALADTDKARYLRIMSGDEGVDTVDGRKVIYAGKKSSIHAAAVVGDTVGDPLKDTSGPALNIVMKLMAIICVVFADFFMSINGGNGASFSGDIVQALGF